MAHEHCCSLAESAEEAIALLLRTRFTTSGDAFYTSCLPRDRCSSSTHRTCVANASAALQASPESLPLAVLHAYHAPHVNLSTATETGHLPRALSQDVNAFVSELAELEQHLLPRGCALVILRDEEGGAFAASTQLGPTPHGLVARADAAAAAMRAGWRLQTTTRLDIMVSLQCADDVSQLIRDATNYNPDALTCALHNAHVYCEGADALIRRHRRRATFTTTPASRAQPRIGELPARQRGPSVHCRLLVLALERPGAPAAACEPTRYALRIPAQIDGAHRGTALPVRDTGPLLLGAGLSQSSAHVPHTYATTGGAPAGNLGPPCSPYRVIPPTYSAARAMSGRFFNAGLCAWMEQRRLWVARPLGVVRRSPPRLEADYDDLLAALGNVTPAASGDILPQRLGLRDAVELLLDVWGVPDLAGESSDVSSVDVDEADETFP